MRFILKKNTKVLSLNYPTQPEGKLPKSFSFNIPKKAYNLFVKEVAPQKGKKWN